MMVNPGSAALLVVALTPALANAQAVPQIGTCPADYHASGGACIPSFPSNEAHRILPKVGMCPSGYRISGDYCLGYQGAKHAIPQAGNCPTGYHQSGAYCLAN